MKKYSVVMTIVSVILAIGLIVSIVLNVSKPKANNEPVEATTQKEKIVLFESTNDKNMKTKMFVKNSFFKLVPSPADYIEGVCDNYSEDEYLLHITYTGVSMDDVLEYAEELRKSGFDTDLSISNYNGMYGFMGCTEDMEYNVALMYSEETQSLEFGVGVY